MYCIIILFRASVSEGLLRSEVTLKHIISTCASRRDMNFVCVLQYLHNVLDLHICWMWMLMWSEDTIICYYCTHIRVHISISRDTANLNATWDSMTGEFILTRHMGISIRQTVIFSSRCCACIPCTCNVHRRLMSNALIFVHFQRVYTFAPRSACCHFLDVL